MENNNLKVTKGKIQLRNNDREFQEEKIRNILRGKITCEVCKRTFSFDDFRQSRILRIADGSFACLDCLGIDNPEESETFLVFKDQVD